MVSSVCMFLFFCATHHPPVTTTAVLRGVPTLRAHSAHTHRPGAHGLLEVPLHLLPSPAKLFQRRISVKIRQVAALHSSISSKHVHCFIHVWRDHVSREHSTAAVGFHFGGRPHKRNYCFVLTSLVLGGLHQRNGVALPTGGRLSLIHI